MELELLIARIQGAKKPEDVFGDVPDGPIPDRVRAMTRIFHVIAATIHPDRNPGAKNLGAVMTTLVGFRHEAEKLLQEGTYGTKRAVVVKATLTSKLGEYVLSHELCRGDVATLYLGQFKSQEVLVKVTRAPGDSDLLDIEAKALTYLRKQTGDTAKTFQKYYPKLLDSFVVVDSGKHRRVNVFPHLPGYRSLAEVRTAYPNGIDPRDAAWMLRRAFEGVGYAHELGRVHGACLPEHILIHPEGHSAQIVGWSYSVKSGQRLTAVSAHRKAMYPPSVFRKEPAKPVVDVQMLGECANFLVVDSSGKMPTSTPKPIQDFFGSCRSGKIVNAWTAYRQYDTVLKSVYGKRSFREFTMP